MKESKSPSIGKINKNTAEGAGASISTRITSHLLKLELESWF